MPRLTPCPSCHSHVLADDSSCPHCGQALRKSAGRGAVVLMGLALAGCPAASSSNVPSEDAGDEILGEPEYGVPDTIDHPPASDDGAGEPVDPATVEPEYGVADSEFPIEPEYGVVDST